MRLRDPDDAPPSLSEYQEDPDARWQEARYRALRAADLHCQICHAEHNTTVWQYLYTSGVWWPFTPGVKPHRADLYVARVQVLVVPVQIPWSGEDADLRVLCRRCYVEEVVRAVRQQSAPPPPPQGALF